VDRSGRHLDPDGLARLGVVLQSAVDDHRDLPRLFADADVRESIHSVASPGRTATTQRPGPAGQPQPRADGAINSLQVMPKGDAQSQTCDATGITGGRNPKACPQIVSGARDVSRKTVWAPIGVTSSPNFKPVSPPSECDVLIVGAGIAGLTAALTIAGERPDLSTLVVDAVERPGGQIRTTVEGGYTFEHGATALSVSRPQARELIARAGLEHRLDPARDDALGSFIYRDGALQAVPRTPREFVASPLLSWRGKLRLLAEPLVGRRSPAADHESVYDFAARRFGHEVARVGATVVLQGVTAGDARKTSLEAVWPRIDRLDRAVGRPGLLGHAVRVRGRAQPPRLYTIRAGGLQVLTDTIAAALGDRLRSRAQVRKIHQDGHLFQATLADDSAVRAPQIVVALSPADAVSVLEPLIAAAPVPAGVRMRVVGLGYRVKAFRERPSGRGFLAAPGEADGVIGAIVSSNLFPDQAPPGRVLVRAFLGGAFAADVADEPSEIAIVRVERTLARLYGLRGEAEFVRDVRWPTGIAQYPRRHMSRVRELERALTALPGLHLARSSITGVGLEHAIEAGATAAGRAINQASVGAIDERKRTSLPGASMRASRSVSLDAGASR
jgi:protoporphyrinogen/coproporphyrinogen III oxidase